MFNDNPDDEFGQRLSRHGPILYRYALTQLRDRHKTDDAVQETLLAALQSRTSFSGGATERSWLVGILKHKIIDQFRRDAREVPLYESAVAVDPETGIEHERTEAGDWRDRPANWGSPEQVLDNRQFWQIVELCLQHLPERQAHLFMMREIFENSTEEICQEMSITSNNLWTMLHRTRLVLRNRLKLTGLQGSSA
ncbi:MAG: sigma-70 family RNA polymerase sigma factor [Burkholderiales bacterium]